MENLEKSTKLESILGSFVDELEGLQKGDNIVICYQDNYYLIKYESFDLEEEPWDRHRHSRFLTMGDMSLLVDDTEEEKEKTSNRMYHEHKRHKLNVYGTHCLDLSFDEEFQIYLPSSSRRDLFLTLVNENKDGDFHLTDKNLKIVSKKEEVFDLISDIVRPGYFKKNIIPFLEGRVTDLKIPGKREKIFNFSDVFSWRNSLYKFLDGLDHGSFAYVGCKQEVYLIVVAKHDGVPYMQGTYTTSLKPMFYFSNNYLEFISKYDAEKPKFEGDGPVNVAEYRTYDIPSFKGKPFIFPQMGRGQNCKNVIVMGEPEVMTTDLAKALDHFKTTDFAEFEDVVRRYSEMVDVIHPSSGEPNGRFYY